MAHKNDQVFQLSLTEIAFTIVFILLLLLGYLVFKEQEDRKAAEDALKSVQGLEKASAALEKAKKGLGDSLRAAKASNPDEVISAMVAAANVQAERERLQREVEDLNAKMTALVELQKALDSAGAGTKGDLAKSEVASALALQNEVRGAMLRAETAKQAASAPKPDDPPTKASDAASGAETRAKGAIAKATTASQPVPATETPKQPATAVDPAALTPAAKQRLDKEAAAKVREAFNTHDAFRREAKSQLQMDVQPGKEQEAVQAVVRNAREYEAMAKSDQGVGAIRKENSDLRGQVAYLKNRLEARGGRDWPPCWADESGAIQFLFTVDLSPDSITLTPAWPPARDVDAKALPGIDQMLAKPLSHQEFQANVQGIFDWSKKHDPQCRHYVYLRNNSIPDSKTSDRVRLMVEGYFYKAEVRR